MQRHFCEAQNQGNGSYTKTKQNKQAKNRITQNRNKDTNITITNFNGSLQRS